MSESTNSLGIELDNIKENEAELREYRKQLYEKIKDCNNRLQELDQNKGIDIFKKKRLNQLKHELEKYIKESEQVCELLIPFETKKMEERITQKNGACDILMNQVSSSMTVLDKDNNSVPLEEDIKLSFIDTIKKFKEVHGLSYEYYRNETKDWTISEALSFDGQNVDILVTTNDYGIAAKPHDHIKGVEQMLQKFRQTQLTSENDKRNVL